MPKTTRLALGAALPVASGHAAAVPSLDRR